MEETTAVKKVAQYRRNVTVSLTDEELKIKEALQKVAGRGVVHKIFVAGLQKLSDEYLVVDKE